MEKEEEAMTTKTAGDEAKPPPARRTRLVRVDQETIDYLLKNHQRLSRPLPELPDNFPADIHASAAAAVKRLIDMFADIIRQYHTLGYAEEVTTDDEATPPVRRRGRRQRRAAVANQPS